MSAQVAADLRAAADVLERDGWIRFTAHSDNGHCAAGAVEAVVDPDWKANHGSGWTDHQNMRFGRATAFLSDHIGGRSAFSVTEWNDKPYRTAAEVIAALREAAGRAEAQS